MSGLDLLKRNVRGFEAANFTPTTFGEVTAANLYSYALQTPLGIPKLGFEAKESSAFRERTDLIKSRFGVDDEFSLIDTSDIDAKYTSPTIDGSIQMMNEKRDRLDAFIEESRTKEPEKWQGIKTKKEILEPLRFEARSAAGIAGDISSRASPTSAVAGTLIGGFGGAMTDVVNIATLPLGFGSSMGILKTMAAEGALNAAIEASQVKGRAEWMNELGLKYGVKEGAADIAFAGAGSAAIVGAVRGSGAVIRSLRGRGSKGVEVLSKAAEDTSLPSEVRDALKYQSRVAHIDEENPVTNPSREEVAAHRNNAQETQNAIREYREPRYDNDALNYVPESMESLLVKAQDIKETLFTVKNIKQELGYTPKSLTQFIKDSGGIQDFGGELRDMDIRLPGLIRKSKAKEGTGQGVRTIDNNMDAVKQRVFDEGYFPDKTDYNEITDSELFDAIKRDLAGDRVYKFDNIDDVRSVNEKLALQEKYDALGITADSSIDEILDVLMEQDGGPRQSIDADVFDQPYPQRLADDPMFFDDPAPLETMRTQTEAMQQSAPAFEADFARLLKEKPDMEIDMDGVVVRLSDVAEEIKQNNNVLNAIRTCAIG